MMNEPSHASKSQRKLWAGAGVVAAIVVGFFGWQHFAPAPKASDRPAEKSAADKPAPDAIAVSDQQLTQIATDVVKDRLVAIDRKATGKIGFNEDRLTPVFAPFPGRIVDLHANKGDSVRSGQPLATVESPDFVGAQNDLSSARSDLVKANIGLSAAQVGGQRAQKLHDQEAISTKDLQQSEADLARAQDDVRRSQAAVAAAENRLRLFGKEPDETASVDPKVILRAPIPGTIVDRKVGPGQYVKPDSPDPLFLISDLSTLWVLVDVYESDVASIRMNMPVEVSVSSYPDRVFPARISFISPTVDPTSRTVRVRCLVPNAAGLLKPDMFATIKIAAAGQQPMATIPSSAVVVEGNDSLVFVADGPGRFKRRPVRVGKEVEGGFIIDSGLRPGEVIATRGALLLNELSKAKE
jgi:cobalt-zinc-cadmium efflux system membrane fusion protein